MGIFEYLGVLISVIMGLGITHLATGAAFLGDAGDAAALGALFDGLAAGERLEVTLKGVGTGVAQDLTGWEVDARIRAD